MTADLRYYQMKFGPASFIDVVNEIDEELINLQADNNIILDTLYFPVPGKNLFFGLIKYQYTY